MWCNDRVNADTRTGGSGAVLFAVAVLAFLAAAGYAIYAAVTTSDLADARDDAPLWVLGAVGAVALVGWWLNRRRRVALEAEARRERERLEEELEGRSEALREARENVGSLRQERDDLRREREDFERRLREREGAVGRERYLRRRAEEGRRAEAGWREELHAEVMRLYRDRGALGDPKDIPGMVLRLARTMVGAEKGLLLSRGDEDSDGRLELLAHEGFENDPGESAIARRFAGEVLERDRTVREERPGQEAEGRTPADEEIENLVAIPIYLQDEFGGVVVCANNPEGFDEYDDEVLLSVGDQAGAALQNARLRGELRQAYLATVGVLADALEVKDPRLRGHSEEVSGYVAAVAERLELPPRRREELLFASLLHDVGKIGISDRILLKPAALTPEERAVVRLHPGIGYRLVQQVPALREISAAVLHHHERFDGEGYPSGLKGQEIPLEARIICVADAFSAMVSDRPYRERVGVEEACAELERCAGMHFDPEVVRVFAEEVRRNPPLMTAEAPLPPDPEVEVRLRGGEPVLGFGPIAQVDNLTGLYTRRYFHEAARAEAQRAEVQGRPFGVVLVELTGLARTNAREGYAAGDEEIRAAAAVVQREAARLGGTAARYGGNRFGVILPALDEETARSTAAGLRDDIAREATPSVAAAASSWRPGDDGESVIARARADLDRHTA